MKKISFFAAMAAGALLLNSCGMNSALVANHNLNSTQVQLSSNNFRVVDKVMGTSDVFYILGIGDMNKKHLFENAYANMMDDAHLTGGSKAIANVVTEQHVWGVFPLYFKRTITVSGNIVEFTK